MKTILLTSSIIFGILNQNTVRRLPVAFCRESSNQDNECKGELTIPTAIELRLDRMVQDLNEIRKEMILKKTRQSSAKAGKVDAWKSLGGRISASWDHVSAVDEINEQRNRAY